MNLLYNEPVKINRERLVDIFYGLVQIDSVSGEEQKLADFLVNFLKSKVDKVTKDLYGNVYTEIKGDGEPIFLSAHMDTVEPGRNIKPTIKNGYIQSDGKTILGVDNKASLASILEVIEILKETNISHVPIELIFTCSEEKDALGGINFNYSKLKARRGYCFDYCSRLGGIIISSPLNERCDIKLIGKATHSTQSDQAINVLESLSEFLNKVKVGKQKEILFNIGQIEVGQSRNSTPSEAIIKAEIRCFTENVLNSQKEFLKEVLRELSDKYKIEFKIEFLREYPAYTHQSEKTKEFIEQTVEKIKQINLEPELIKDWAISDANTFNHKGLLCLNLADGGENPHSIDERIKISELENLSRLILKIVSN
jgi:tripeptide aminopeptidase